MPDDNSYTLKEVVESSFKEMRTHLEEIKTQTTKTNGRVNSLEKTRIQVWTAISIILVVSSAVITLAIMAIDSKIQRGIDTAFNTRFDNISITNNNGN